MAMMAQGVLPFQVQAEKTVSGMTGLAGLSVYLELAQVAGLRESVMRHVQARASGQGWSDAQMVAALVLLNLAGGDCVEDLRRLESDEGFCRLLGRLECFGLPRRERRELEKRWRRERRRSLPSASAVFRYLSSFHDEKEELRRVAGTAFIPARSEPLRGLAQVNGDLLAFVQQRSVQAVATLDQDATVVATQKRNALWSYQKCQAYQPQNVWWAEQGLVVHSEFRDGNVPAGFEQLRVLKEALALLPEGVEQVRLRSDAAGYQHDLLRYCELAENTRFGRIEFAISCPVSPEFGRAVAAAEDWQPLGDDEQECAEVCFVPNAIAHGSNDPVLRYLAIREPLRQLPLPGCEAQTELALGCPAVSMGGQRYKISGMVTNRSAVPAAELIGWQRQRCGKSEEAHGAMKEDLAGGKLPSGDFGENAAWWAIMILALNLNAAMKKLALGQSWGTKRMKAMRFHLICLPGRVIEHGRQLVLRLSKNHPALELLLEVRSRIYGLQLAAPAT